MKYTFLTEKFYHDHPHEEYEQMEMKRDRPYAHVQVELNNHLFCLPLRSHIEHPHAFFTNKKEKCGVDYSKAVVINDEAYIDRNRKAFLRQDEYKRLQGKDFIIKKQFNDYIELYNRAKIDETIPHRDDILKYSTLQYFEEYLTNEKGTEI